MAEVKTEQHTVFDYPIKAINDVQFYLNCYPLSPNGFGVSLSQGTGQSDRIGNKVNTKRVMLRAFLTPAPYDVTINPIPQPIVVTMWIFRTKDRPNVCPNSSAVGALYTTEFFENNNSQQGFQGTLADLMFTTNRTKITLLKKKEFKLGFSEYWGTNDAPLDPVKNAFQLFANNDFKMCHRIKMDVTKYVKKSFTYNDTSTTPSEAGTWLLWTWHCGSGELSDAYRPAAVSQYLDYSFTDM